VTEKSSEALQHLIARYRGEDDPQIVKSEDEISIGGVKLKISGNEPRADYEK
jgi:hypothetical protein